MAPKTHDWPALVAPIIADLLVADATYGDAYATPERIGSLNRDGWLVETPAPLGGWVRHEGVTLTDAGLRRAVALAEASLSAR